MDSPTQEQSSKGRDWQVSADIGVGHPVPGPASVMAHERDREYLFFLLQKLTGAQCVGSGASGKFIPTKKTAAAGKDPPERPND